MITVWLGQGQAVAAMTLRIFSAAFFMSAVVSALSSISIGRGEPQYQMRTMLVQTALNIVLSTTLVLSFGYFGAVTGTAIATLSGAVLFFRIYGRRLVPDPLKLLASVISWPVICAVAAGIVCWFAFAGIVHLTGAGGRVAVAGVLAISGLLYVLLYAMLLFWTRTVTADDAGFLKGVLPHRLTALLARRA